MHRELLRVLDAPDGLILVAGYTGQGKTTVIEGVLADPGCRSDVAFVGDIRSVEQALRTVALARAGVILGVLRIGQAAGVFGRLIDMGAAARDVADIVRVAFATRLFRPPRAARFMLLHEDLRVTDAIRALILAGADVDTIHRQAIAEGMRSLRKAGLVEVDMGRLPRDYVIEMTPDD